jgi:hypothetical protein
MAMNDHELDPPPPLPAPASAPPLAGALIVVLTVATLLVTTVSVPALCTSMLVVYIPRAADPVETVIVALLPVASFLMVHVTMLPAFPAHVPEVEDDAANDIPAPSWIVAVTSSASCGPELATISV